MTAKHNDPEYRRNARLIRQQVTRARRLGLDVTCWRCGRPIDPEQRYDIGHINHLGRPTPDNLAPEHRGENRRHGGRQGAALQGQRRAVATGMLPW